ncbi:MAG: rhomboid family intramembrane serine protease [Armatimonadota bacterium]
MIPFRDENPSRTFPIVVVGLIAANVVVFVYQSMMPDLDQMLFFYTYGAVPAVLLGKATLAQVLPDQIRSAATMASIRSDQLQPVWLSIFTSMFVHGGLTHIGGNMLYLWIFGNNIEDALGHGRFLVFYFLCGLIAAGGQMLMSMSSPVPMIGASGAIAGVLGAYYLKFPRARVRCLVFLFFFITVATLPAGLVLLLWFLLQVYQSLGAVGAHTAAGGVAVFAHIAGFIGGYVLVRRFEPRRRIRLSQW